MLKFTINALDRQFSLMHIIIVQQYVAKIIVINHQVYCHYTSKRTPYRALLHNNALENNIYFLANRFLIVINRYNII